MPVASNRTAPSTPTQWSQRLLRWTATAAAVTALLALLSHQLFLGHQASGKSIEWAQAAAWAIPTLLAWCGGLPLTMHAARRWPLAAPIRLARIACHVTASLVLGGGLLIAHVAISWMLGWIPRDRGIVPFELIMTGRSYGWFNLLAYWGIVAWIGTRPLASDAAEHPATSTDPFVVRTGDRRILVPPDEIEWAEAAGNYVRLHTKARTHLVRMPLRELAGRLDAKSFVRIHRSVLVRQTAVRELRRRPAGDYAVTLTDGTTVTLSRRFRREALPRLMGE